MEQQKLKIFIDEIPFEIDLKERSLYHPHQPERKLDLDEIGLSDGYFHLAFDQANGTIHPLAEAGAENKEIKIPFALLTPTQEAVEAFNKISAENDLGILIADERLEARLRGELPKIDVAGALFYVDWRLRELRMVDEPWTRLNLRDMDMNDAGDRYLCLYNTEYKAIYIPTQYTKQIPDKVVVLEIPYELKLDPVAVARQFELPDTAMLKNFPIEKDLKATVKQLNKMEAQQLLNNVRNQYRQKTEQQQQNNSKRKGKRL
jgi:hypothetical protein